VDVKLIGIDHALLLETGEEVCGLTFRLPDGVVFRAVVDGEVENHIRGLLSGRPSPPVPERAREEPAREVDIMPTASPPAAEPSDDKVYWSRLPDSVVSATMKESLRTFGIREPLTVKALHDAMEDITRLAMASSQGTGTVVWKDDAPQYKKGPPIRFQRQTRTGYPVDTLPSPQEDPGELPEGEDVDEDGIGQI